MGALSLVMSTPVSCPLRAAGAGLAEQPALLSGSSLPWEQSQLGSHVRAGLLLPPLCSIFSA